MKEQSRKNWLGIEGEKEMMSPFRLKSEVFEGHPNKGVGLTCSQQEASAGISEDNSG